MYLKRNHRSRHRPQWAPLIFAHDYSNAKKSTKSFCGKELATIDSYPSGSLAAPLYFNRMYLYPKHGLIHFRRTIASPLLTSYPSFTFCSFSLTSFPIFHPSSFVSNYYLITRIKPQRARALISLCAQTFSSFPVEFIVFFISAFFHPIVLFT